MKMFLPSLLSNISNQPVAAMQLVECPSKAEKKAALVLSKHHPVHTKHSYLRYMLKSSKWVKKFM